MLDVYGVGAGQLAGASAAAFTATIGVTLVVSYAVNLVCVLVVRRGVKDPAKMKLGMVLFGILSVLALVSLARALLDGTGLEALTQSVATAVMNCCVFYGALKLNASAKQPQLPVMRAIAKPAQPEKNGPRGLFLCDVQIDPGVPLNRKRRSPADASTGLLGN